MNIKIILLVVFFVFLIGCSEKINVNNLTYDEIHSCRKDSDCQQISGCHENGGSECVNFEYVDALGTPNKNCDTNDVWPCYTCECKSGKCVNILNEDKFGC